MHQTLIFSFFPLLSGSSAPRAPRPVRFYHLPIELLQLIFEDAVTEFDDNSDRTPTFSDAHTLSLVCKSWRTIVLNTPILWSVVDAHHPAKVLDLSLHRASDAPLTLYLGPDHADTTTDASWKLYQRIHLFTSFNSRPRVDDWHILRGQLCSTSPLLESFKLSMYSFVQPRHYLPKNMFGGVRPPRLRELHLRGFHIPWDSSLLHNLTVLNLEAQNRPTYKAFIQSLQNMKSLQKLSLDDSLPIVVDRNDDIVSLPNLRTIEIKDNVGLCTSFLQYVKLSPTSIGLHLQAMSLGGDGGSEALFHALSTRIHVNVKAHYMDRFIIHTEEVFYWSGQTCRIVGSLPRIGDSVEDVSIDIALQTHHNEGPTAIEHCLTCALRHLPLSSVRELALCMPTRLSYTFWMVILPTAFPAVSELAFTKETMPLFFAAYAEFFRRRDAQGACRQNIPFRRLNRVTCDLSLGFDNSVKSVLHALTRAPVPWLELIHENCDWKLIST